MKVKCISNEHYRNYLTIGKEYKVLEEYKHLYKMKDDSEDIDYFPMGYFKIVNEEENKMKEYSFEEVITNIKIGESYKCTKDIYYINKISRNDAGFKFNDGKSVEGCATNNAQRFVKEETPVSFMEVVKSDSRCKVEHYRIKEIIEEEDSCFKWLESYQNLDDIIHAIGEEFNTIACKEILRDAKWYLEN